ncbi:MAG: hypothetical protein CMK89_12535 [Pseudomonadales bacterium]|nr:hypothetical protein [Pseudomonadales bacterium]RLU02676.1 MAG: DNA-binding response regulator [Ketobacter sp.]
MTYDLLLIEDQALVRESLASLLNSTGQFSVSYSLDNVRDAIPLLQQHPHLDLILCDYHLKQDTAETLLRNRHLIPPIPVVLLTSHFNAMALQHCLSLGAQGFLFKESGIDEFIHALTLIANGGVFFSTPETPLSGAGHDAAHTRLDLQLTDTETEILKWLATGMSNKQIALSTGKSSETIKTHVTRILKKLQCKTRTQAVTKAGHFNLL